MGVLAHAWARFFGTLGVGWLALLRVANVEDVIRAAYESALLILIPTYLGGLLVVWLYGKGPAVRHAWPLVLILGTILGVGQLLVALISPELSTFLAAAVALLALYPLSRWKRFGDPIQGIPNRPAMVERQVSEQTEAAPVMSLSMSFLPYVVLTAVTLSVLLIPSLNAALRQVRIGLPFPGVETGFGVKNAAVASYAPIAPFTHPGAMLLITAVIIWVVYKSGGYYRAWAVIHKSESIWSGLLVDAVPASVPVIAFLVTSRILDHSGQVLTLAYGIAAASPPLVYAGLASVIGALGAFMTSSSTASCVLFGAVQASVAQLHGLSRETIIAAQAAGSAYGNAIAPANIVLGTSIAGVKGQEGAVLRQTMPWTILVAVLTGLATVALVLVR
jgi:lactate permease